MKTDTVNKQGGSLALTNCCRRKRDSLEREKIVWTENNKVDFEFSLEI